ncbi:serine/threonine protein kinase [Methylibium sp.]|uniref:serine/threonine protein kinase n=1 Tax=Methylibium sp. TaxID=2067992 RepID=UPI003D0A28F4
MPMSAAPITTPGALPAGSSVSRRLGRFELKQLLGKSSRTMLWLAHDPAAGADRYLTLPRQQPVDAAALEAWLRGARHAARLNHPQLLPVTEVGVEERWPFLAGPAVPGLTLDVHLARGELPSPAQAAQWLCDVLQGLAFVHEAGLAHGDVGGYSVLIDPQGHALLLPGADVSASSSLPAGGSALAVDPGALRSQRDAGARDLQACGLLLHRLLAGQPALDEADPPTALLRLDREIVRLGWTTPQPVPDALRAIANRATEREPQRRYLGARSLQRALQGWLEAQADGGGGVLALLLDRLHSVGHLPALPGLLARVSAVAAMEQQRIDEMAELIIQDPALAFELLRQVNAAQFAAHAAGGVTTVRRAVQLLGVQGLRPVASGLRPWPGALAQAGADALAASLREARLAAHIARTLCPADMDGEEAFLLALLQHLGTLLVRYHFPEEAEQIHRLVDPEPGGPRGMTEAAAACAVIGVELETLALAVARHWGFDEAVLHAMRRVSLDAPVRTPDHRGDTLRLLASVAVEAAAATASQESRAVGTAAALARVSQRYARALVLGQGELSNAVQQAQRAVDAALLPRACATRACALR